MKAPLRVSSLKDSFPTRRPSPHQGKTKADKTKRPSHAVTAAVKKNDVDNAIKARLARAAGIKQPAKFVDTFAASKTVKTPERSNLQLSPIKLNKRVSGSPHSRVSSPLRNTGKATMGRTRAEQDSSTSARTRSSARRSLFNDDGDAAAVVAGEKEAGPSGLVAETAADKFKDLMAKHGMVSRDEEAGPSGLVAETAAEKYKDLMAKHGMTPPASVDEEAGPSGSFKNLNAEHRMHAAPAPQEAGPSGVVDETKSRYRYLLDKDERSLRMPFKYQILLAKFIALESTCMIQQHVQRKTVTFDTARPSVERTCSKEFSLDDLARIKSVYPDAYDLTLIHRNGRSSTGVRGTIAGYHQGQSTIRISADFGNDLEVDQRMADRKEAFIVSLMDITFAAHKFFLRELPVPIECNDDELTEWHPDFQLDNVPDIKKAALPQAKRPHVPSAADILNSGADMSTEVKQALEHVVAKQSIPSSPAKRRRLGDEGQGQGAEAEQSAPLTLRERIRLKERLKKEEQLRREQTEVKGAKEAKRQWECASILRSYSLAKRKNVIPLVDCITAVKRCYATSISEVRIKDTLVELTEIVQAWCSISKIQKMNYFVMVPAEFGATQKYFHELMGKV